MTRLLICAALVITTAGQSGPATPAGMAKGPLRVHPQNPRYFTDATKLPDGSLKAVYLTGSHTWDSLVDMGRSDPPESFDFNRYLDFLERHGHNFIRLWAWDSTIWDTRANAKLGKDFVHNAAPLPWSRTGPGLALDGKPKFDLTKFDNAYFTRLRERVNAAGRRGIYVSVMLFEGWGLMHANRGRAAPAGWAWRSHPFNPANNVNQLTVSGSDDISGKVHRLGDTTVNDLQAAYIGRVVDAVNEFDNVLYEVINEGGEREWDWWVVERIQKHQRSKRKQHPVGITGHGAERVASMLASPAEWISPGRADGYADDPPAWSADHRKVSVIDTDHIWGVGGNVDWVWKSFVHGHNPIFMDPYDGLVLGQPADPRWEPIRVAMGHTRRLADRLTLATMAPADAIASSGYCLAAPGREYVVYVPGGGKVSVDLSAAKGRVSVEWFEPATGRTTGAGEMPGGARQEFEAPFTGSAVLYLKLAERR